MAARLPSPYKKHCDTSKDRVSARGKGVFSDVEFALSSMQGWRMTQEDAHCHLFPSKNNPNIAFVGVFDGHAGDKASSFVSRNILKCIENSPAYSYLKSDCKTEVIARAVIEGFFDCDELMASQKAFKSGDYSGCTGVVCVLTKNAIIVGNAGDSRCVIARGNDDIFSTRDHKPDDQREEERVRFAGGTVTNGRIKGDLASARSFGDFRYKGDKKLPPSQQLVTVNPDVAILDRHKENQLLILACDGIWDVMSNIECINFILAALSLGASVQYTADLVLEECTRKGSGDNMSILIITLDGLRKVKGGKTPTLDQVRREMYRKIL